MTSRRPGAISRLTATSVPWPVPRATSVESSAAPSPAWSALRDEGPSGVVRPRTESPSLEEQEEERPLVRWRVMFMPAPPMVINLDSSPSDTERSVAAAPALKGK